MTKETFVALAQEEGLTNDLLLEITWSIARKSDPALLNVAYVREAVRGARAKFGAEMLR